MKSTIQFVDIHSHLADDYFSDNRAEVLRRMREHNVGTISIGTDRESSTRAVALACAHDMVWACVGVHPEHATEEFDAHYFASLVNNPRVVAVGECGLDYFRTTDIRATRVAQLPLFEAHIECALTKNIPLMLHVRPSKKTLDAYEDALAILMSWKHAHPHLRGNVHFFSGTEEIARRFFDLDFTISFTGVITFTSEYDDVVRFSPLSRIHAETDAPFVAPVPYRGQPCEPWMVQSVVQRIARLKCMSDGEVIHALCANAKRIFGLTTAICAGAV